MSEKIQVWLYFNFFASVFFLLTNYTSSTLSLNSHPVHFVQTSYPSKNMVFDPFSFCRIEIMVSLSLLPSNKTPIMPLDRLTSKIFDWLLTSII